MVINFKAPENLVLKPKITVFGVGGAGGNAVNNMIRYELQGVNFVVANTDAQALEKSICTNKLQLGVNLTKGLGAGAFPEVGAKAAEESTKEIEEYLANSNMVFITAGMGGGTGTGASTVIARIAKEMGILTVGVVTKPFDFEGKNRMRMAEEGLSKLEKFVDTLIIIPNQNLFRVSNNATTFIEAFKAADDVLHSGVRCVTDLMTMPGLINLDFADINAIMKDMGAGVMGTGEASGEDRAIKATEDAINNPLLHYNSIKGAKKILINITGGEDLTLNELNKAAEIVTDLVSADDALIIFGSAFHQELTGTIRVSVIATGIDHDSKTVLNKSTETILNSFISSNNNVNTENAEDINIAQFDEKEAKDLFDSRDNAEEYNNNYENIEEEHKPDSELRYSEPKNEFPLYEENRDRLSAQSKDLYKKEKKTKSFLGKIWETITEKENKQDLEEINNQRNIYYSDNSLKRQKLVIREAPNFSKKSDK